MPNSTSRLALVQPVGADAASELRVAIAANATTLDPAVLQSSGTISSRPAATSVPVGNEYYATDTAQWFKSNGSVWMLTAGADTGWLNITIAVGSAWSGAIPQARQIGNKVMVRGGWELATNQPGGTVLGTMPVGIAGPNLGFAYFSTSVFDNTAGAWNLPGSGEISGTQILELTSSVSGSQIWIINDFEYSVV